MKEGRKEAREMTAKYLHEGSLTFMSYCLPASLSINHHIYLPPEIKIIQ